MQVGWTMEEEVVCFQNVRERARGQGTRASGVFYWRTEGIPHENAGASAKIRDTVRALL